MIRINMRKAMPATKPPSTGLSQKDIAFARVAAQAAGRKTAFSLEINGNSVPAESYLAHILQDCLKFVAEGHPVVVMPADDEIGTQEAADILKVSRPYLVKLLDSKAIPSRKVGVQRRVRIEDVLGYKEREKAARKKVLEELAAESQRLNLGE